MQKAHTNAFAAMTVSVRLVHEHTQKHVCTYIHCITAKKNRLRTYMHKHTQTGYMQYLAAITTRRRAIFMHTHTRICVKLTL